MSFQVTDAQQAILKFLGIISNNAPDPIKAKVRDTIKAGKWGDLVKFYDSIKDKLSLSALVSESDFAKIAPLSKDRRDVYRFMIAIKRNVEFDKRINQLVEWGGFSTIAKIVNSNDNIPFSFNSTDIEAVIDPLNKIRALTENQIGVKDFLYTIKLSSNPDVQKFAKQIDSMIHNGCWKKIADLVNEDETIPFNFTVSDLKTVLDPQNRITDDPDCSSIAIPEPPAHVKAIIWVKGAGNWTKNAGENAYKWTTGAGKDTINWCGDTGEEVKDWFEGAGSDTADWTTGAGSDAANWTKNAGSDAADWAAGAGSDAADWTKNAGSDAADWAKKAGEKTADVFNPTKW